MEAREDDNDIASYIRQELATSVTYFQYLHTLRQVQSTKSRTIKKSKLILAFSCLHHPQNSFLGNPGNDPSGAAMTRSIPGSSPLTTCLVQPATQRDSPPLSQIFGP